MATDTTTVPQNSKIYKGIVFSPDQGNYVEWLHSTYNALKWNHCKWNLLARCFVPLVEGQLLVKKSKPEKGTIAEQKAWEDKTDQALLLINESLEEHSWVIRECDTPAEAFKTMFDLYSGATQNEAVHLETQ